MRAIVLGVVVAGSAWAGDCPPKVELPKEWAACTVDSECVLAGDGCRTCSNWLPVNAKFQKAATEKDAKARVQAKCVMSCEACSPGVVSVSCRAGTCVAVAAGTVLEVGLDELLRNPTAWDGKRVRVRGFFALGFELAALFPSAAELKRNDFGRSIWLETDGAPAELEKLKGKEVVVDAVFAAGRKGHLGGWAGALEQVSRVSPAPGSGAR